MIGVPPSAVFAREYLGSLEGRYPGRTPYAVKAVDVGRTGNRHSKGRTLAMCRTYFGLFRPSPAPVPESKNFDPQCPLLADSSLEHLAEVGQKQSVESILGIWGDSLDRRMLQSL